MSETLLARARRRRVRRAASNARGWRAEWPQLRGASKRGAPQRAARTRATLCTPATARRTTAVSIPSSSPPTSTYVVGSTRPRFARWRKGSNARSPCTAQVLHSRLCPARASGAFRPRRARARAPPSRPAASCASWSSAPHAPRRLHARARARAAVAVCSLPVEYCEFQPSFDKCKEALVRNWPTSFPDVTADGALRAAPPRARAARPCGVHGSGGV